MTSKPSDKPFSKNKPCGNDFLINIANLFIFLLESQVSYLCHFIYGQVLSEELKVEDPLDCKLKELRSR